MTEKSTCVIAGAGPAGMMLGLLLARAGVETVVLEKHGDFLRDFRGDTIHASTLQLMDELGLTDDINKMPLQKIYELGVITDDGRFTLADFRRLPGPYQYIAFLPQWDFLNFLLERAERFPAFQLRRNAEVTDVLVEDDRVCGVRYRDATGEHELRADLTVSASGRRSSLGLSAGLEPRTFGSPMDILWFQLSKKPDDPGGMVGRLSGGQLFVRVDRGEYWQAAYGINKGGAHDLRARGLDAFRSALTELEPFLADRVGELTSWDDVQVLDVQIDRLRKWWRPGFLCIGDAAHCMSPIGGVGINLALQDAVAAANILAEPLRTGSVTEGHLARIQRRRTPPTVFTQRIQRFLQRRFLEPLFRGERRPGTPAALKVLSKVPALQAVPARVIGIGIRPEHVSEPIVFPRAEAG